MSRTRKLLGLTALTLSLGLALSGCTSDKNAASSPTPGVQASSAAPSVSATPALTQKQQIAIDAADLFNGLFHTAPATAKKIVALNNNYSKTDKATYIKEVEAFVPALQTVLQHTGQTTKEIADSEYALTLIAMPPVASATQAQLDAVVYQVDASKVTIASSGTSASLAPSGIHVTVSGKEATQSGTGSPLEFTKAGGKWGISPKALTSTK